MIQDIRRHIKQLIQEMSKGAYEREEVIALSLLSAFAGESIFLLGLPGVGKSMVARRLKSAFKDSTCFEYLMSRFSTPDEIFGPVSISKLKDEDTYERCVDGYLPTADVIFLDEIWKAGPAIQNSLLTALNEKIFHNGKDDLSLPLKGIIAASNELPAEDEGLEALWDRFLIRYVVQPVSDKSAFMKLIGGNNEVFCMPDNLPVTDAEYKEIQDEISKVAVPERVMDALFALRTVLSQRFENRDEIDDPETGVPYVSDRRWKKIVGILRASAYLNGRNEVNLSDCLLLEHMIWDKDAQITMVKKDIAKMVTDGTMMAHKGVKTDSAPVEQFVTTPDGKCYIVIAGHDEFSITIEDYDKLRGGKAAYGRFTSGNRILVDTEAGDFRLKSEVYGTLTMNSFKYQLKKNPTKKSTTLDELVSIPETIEDEIAANIFLRNRLEDYPQLNAMTNKFKGFRK